MNRTDVNSIPHFTYIIETLIGEAAKFLKNSQPLIRLNRGPLLPSHLSYCGLNSKLFDVIVGSSIVFCDSQSGIQLATKPICQERYKHIDFDCDFIREYVCSSFLKLVHNHIITTPNIN
ncbi:hypothetical protein MTR_5g094070 [Medicago truncatula]|uniref:Uncharacterized protein n=1 Tax=Medicago truncatula TaxID=3880 RepID=G7K4A7_MEDTR|nr:hypothetical protein MTR_5g094070 [Medicago truncatula]